MNAAKKNSVAKQTKPKTEKGYYNKDGKKYQYDATTTDAAGANLEAPGAISGGEAGVPWQNKMKDLFKSGVSVDELVKKGHGTKEKLSNLFKGLEQNASSTPGKVDIKDELVMTDPTEGTTVDASNVYGVYRIAQGQKKAAKDVRKASIKLGKYADFDYNPDGSINMESVKPKEGLSKNARKMAKFNERVYELTSMNNTRKRIAAQAEAGVDPKLTARFKIGTKMKEGTPGGPDTNVEGLETDTQVKDRLNKGVNLGTVSSTIGDMPEGDALNDILRKNINEKENAKVTTPVSTAVSNVMSDVVSRGFSTTSSGLTKKYTAPTSMLKKSGMKMGGFGSKTYKK